MNSFETGGSRLPATMAATASDDRMSRKVLHYDRNRNLQEMVLEQARAMPDKTAIVFGDRSITYSELDRLSDTLAAFLARSGVGKGDIVGLHVPRALNTVVAKLAILKAGGAYLPLDPAFPAEHLDYVIGQCAPKVIFIDAAYRSNIGDLPNLQGDIVVLDDILAELEGRPAETPPPVAVDGGDLAYVMYTSGSTGRPKGVSISHRGIARVALDQNYAEFGPDDVILHAATIAFDITTLEVWSALLNGCLLAGVPQARFSLADMCEVIKDNGVTFALLTTGLFNLFADYAAGEMPTLKHVMYGGEVGSVAHSLRFMAAHPGCRLTNAYGPTESTVITTAFDIPPDFGQMELPIGKAVAHTGLCVVDDDLRPLPPGELGQLTISGDGVALGYLGRPDLTEEKFVIIETEEGPARSYLTGDLAIMEEDGNVIFKGRRDRQIKLNGKRIELDEIEAVLRLDSRLADGVVACHSSGPSAMRIVAYLCPKSKGAGQDPNFTREVIVRLRAILPAYMVPSAFVVLDELPLHPSGKIDRSKLPPPPAETVPAAAPVSPVETVLTALWQDVLATRDIDPGKNFFDLGGTSLQLMRIHAALEQEFGRSIDVVMLFKHPTIRELARFLDGKSQASARTMSASQRASLGRKTMSQFRRSAQ